MRILIADDSIVARLNAQRTSTKFGPVSLATDGKEALKLSLEAIKENQAFDLILLDLDMPSLNGEGFLTALRAEEERTPDSHPSYVIIVSASINKSKMVSLMTLDCSDYLAKPYTDTELMEKMFEVKKLISS